MTARIVDDYDFIVVGSGGGAMCAALYLRSKGLRPLVLEKTDKVGGSTAMSGGVLWIPNNHILARDGIEDSLEKAMTYMEAVVGDAGSASSPQRRKAYLTYGPRVIRFLESKGLKFLRPAGYADYYDDRPGGVPESRALVVPLFNLRELGPWQARLRRLSYFAMPLSIEEFNLLALARRSWRGRLMALRLAFRFAKQKLLGQDWVGCGCALQGRMLQAALRNDVTLMTDTPVNGLVEHDGRVIGVRAMHEGEEVEFHARLGVLINAGGFAHNAAMRAQYGRDPASTVWTNANPGDTGEMIAEAMRIGASVDMMDEAWWVPVSLPSSDIGFNPFHVSEMGKPHCILVDSQGQRICNESASYMEIGQAIYDRHRTTPAIPAFMVFDHKHRSSYPLFTAAPGITPKEWLESGYVLKADTLDDLARQCGIDSDGLQSTVSRFNEMARVGRDTDFGRGDRVYDTWFGDPDHVPSPTLGEIAQGPFYAVRVFPGDIGTSGGLMTDETARVLREDGSVIDGLYATGNSTASVMGRTYPGAGASIGASFIFGYIAAEHAAAGG